MKKIFSMIIPVMTLTTLTACASPSMKFNVTVTDSDTLLPIQSANVKFLFRDYQSKAPGMGWGTRVVSRTQSHKTDKNGVVIAEGKANLKPDNLPIIIKKAGYYEGYTGLIKPVPSYNKILNRWEPWPCEATVKLRPIKDPVMYVKRVEASIPEKNKLIGYDLEVGDWVAPYGEGKTSDFILKMKEGDEGNNKIKLDTFDITFSNKLDGIQEFKGIKGNQSTFAFPYLAPVDGYLESHQFHRKWNKTERYGYQFQGDNMKGKTFFFRTRTRTDGDGNIISAKYGIITGIEFSIYKDEFRNFRLTYKLNPDNKSRSLEFNDRNLFESHDEQDRLK